ncbi:MAG: hypothetical protein KGD74_01960 [Candidatus Lokiarchaeota archaeon]|nr:hypothetical protein [Candidatus Lokiarchaeota archaeon]
MPASAHFGIGLAAKRFFPKIPLWALLISVMAIDILSFIFIFALWPSHGLFMAVVWSASAMLITALITAFLKSKKEQDKNMTSALWNIEILYTSMIIGLLVFSHWVLDLIGWPMTVINPDATGVPLLFDDSVWIGLGVYTTWFGALTMDIGVFVAGLAIYLHYEMKIKTKKVIDKRSPME